MRNGLLYRIVCLLSLCVLFACDRDAGKSLIIPSKGEYTRKDNNLSYLTLNLRQANAVHLRSTSVVDPMTEIKSLMLLFYDAESAVLKDIKDITIQSPQDLQNISLKLKAADYKLVALANPSAKVRAQLNKGARLSDIEQGLNLLSSDLLDSSTSAVLMSNEQGVAHIDKGHFASSEAASQQQSFSLSLSPAVARVLLYGEPRLRAGVKGNKPIKYMVNNLPQQVYLMRRMTKLSTGAMEVAGDNSSVATRYAETPLWSVWGSSQPQNTQGINSYGLDALTAQEMGNTAHTSLDAYQAEYRQPSLYCKESTLPETAFLQGLAPYVHIAYPYIPQELSLSTNEGWLSYQGRVYPESKAKELLRDPQSSEALAQALRANRITEADFTKPTGFSKGGIQFYYQGYNYYTVFIKHFTGEARYGRYGVVRANEYRIQLLSINNPGSPTPILHNTLEPIDEAKSSAFQISVSTTNNINQNAEL